MVARPNSTQNAIYSDLSQFDSLPLADSLESLRCSTARMRKMKEALDEPNVDFFALISKQDLKKNFDYFIKVLDHVVQDERKQVFFNFYFSLFFSSFCVQFIKFCVQFINPPYFFMLIPNVCF